MAVSVNDLCTLDFASRPFEQQLQIVALGRPLPLKTLSESATSKNIRTLITPQLFEQVQWLAYCEERKIIFCWPCLLFDPQTSMVSEEIGSNLEETLVIMDKHEVTKDHLTCSLKLQMFISKNFQPRVSTVHEVEHNCAVKNNREMLKCVIDAVCCVVGQKQLDCGKYSFNLISIENCKNFLKLLKNCHPRKADVVDNAVELLNTNSYIVSHLVDAMTRAVKMSIQNETKKSTYVSIIVSEHGSSRVKSQMSTILRYINRGKVCERFIGFINSIGIKTRKQLSQYIFRPIEEYGIADRFLALSLDGKISYGQSLSLLIESISANYSFSYFVPWYAHGFGCVLLQTLSVYSECTFFLKMIHGIQDFFRNKRHFESFEILLHRRIPGYNRESTPMKWNLHSNFIVRVAKFRRYFIEFFRNVIRSNEREKNEIFAQAMAFRSFLKKFRNVFLLKLFYEIFSHDFDETFNFPPHRYAFSSDRINQYKRRVVRVRFVKIQQVLVDEAEKDKALKSALRSKSKMKKCRKLFKKVIRHLKHEILLRSIHLATRLSFCDLFDALRDCPGDEVSVFNKQFHDLQKRMMNEHGRFFDDEEVRVEMAAIKSNQDLCAKTVHELLEYFAEYNLRGLFPQTYKLVEFILTLPYLPASFPAGVSKLEDIKRFSYFPEGNGIPSGEVSFLSIECEMLQSLRQSSSFYDDVLTRFYEVIRTISLVQV